MNLQVKQRIPLKIKRMGINGEGIGFYKKTLVFVPGALKGEEVFCQIVSVKRNFVQAKLLKINKASKFRVDPECGVYEECGGCQLMHLRYDKQLEFKTDLLGQALKKFKQFQTLVVRQIGKKLKCIRTDNGGEYCGPFDVYCKQQGIRHEKTPPKTTQLNGLAERMNRTLIERVRCMLTEAKLPKVF